MSLQILGTSHIAQESLDRLSNAVEHYNPDIIAVELDLPRAQALLSEAKNRLSLRDIGSIGVVGFLFALLGQSLQQKLGKMVGLAPGSEMKQALLLAREKKIALALIDQPIRITLRNFSQALTWKEKGRFIVDIFRGIFQGKKQLQKLGLDHLDLQKVPAPELIEKMISQLKERYPNIYKTLVEDRNKYMVKQLIKLMRSQPEKKILCIVGAGHQKGMEELLLKVDVVK